MNTLVHNFSNIREYVTVWVFGYYDKENRKQRNCFTESFLKKINCTLLTLLYVIKDSLF